MKRQSYLIDTNVLFGLEDNHEIGIAYASFLKLAASHRIAIFVHEAVKEDILRDKNALRRKVSLTKAEKYTILHGMHGVDEDALKAKFGPLRRPNDVVDAKLLHSVLTGAVDFLVTEDRGLHSRAHEHSAELQRRVLFLSDAVDLLTQTYEPRQVPIRHVAEVKAHEINHSDGFFDSLREGYPGFDDWWREKCVEQHRPCWVVRNDGELAGLIVRKDETSDDTDAVSKARKILKICTFKVSRNMRGIKLGELLLKQVLWYAQANNYGLAYLTVYEEQIALIELLKYYGFESPGKNPNGELIYERKFSSGKLSRKKDGNSFDVARRNYPRFLFDSEVDGFGIPIKEDYHDILYPDLRKLQETEADLEDHSSGMQLGKPGNTIRKVYLSRASSKLGKAGSILFFYKGKSRNEPSQAMTAIGILESVTLACSTKQLIRLTGDRSVYSKKQLDDWAATSSRPVKVINYLLVAYIEPPIGLNDLQGMGIVGGHPQQSIYKLSDSSVSNLLQRANLDFKT